ncbi:enoyl-CoA hydratase-related protein [Halobacteriovorax sp. GB3]|uniref:enoyl-CoA hydratase-related protein n=1 Tax=Halobacteriovorax sp. GB3 TaxID=2719615 RepID=UPI0023609FFD|nr:enoyl-CoA hydratase-related protein [Halobacteriovorax sp. GB3]MDD0853330.1 enoyl-CoA hydratase-related protein [Halobacteriovorax sp. GB3]
MSTYSDLKDLKVVKEDNLLWLSLDNSKMSNAITSDMIDSLELVLEKAENDQSISVVILKGEGKHFCAGGDVKAMLEQSGMFAGEPLELGKNYKKFIQRIPLAMERFQKPLIAMVNGAAIGAGCDLACMCDLRIGSEKSRFGETFAKLGLVPGDGGTFFLQRVVGYSKAMEMILTGDLYVGEQAKQMGLLTRLVSSEDLESKTRELAIHVSSLSISAIELTKRAMKMAMKQDLSSHLEVLSMYQGIAQRSDDHLQALESFKK